MILAALALAASAPQTVLTVDPAHRLIEGVASDGTTIWVSSLMDRQILVCAKSCSTLATLPEGLHPFALAWDSRRQRLWVAADCPPGVPFIVECDRGALLGLDTRGKIKSWLAPISGPFHPGDVSASNGEVFASDSQSGAVYPVGAKAESLLTLVATGVGKSGQGSVLTANGKALVTSDYSQGIAVVDLPTGKRTLAPKLEGKPSLRGVDGLARCGDTYFGIYNGSTPGRLFAFHVTKAGVDYADLIEGLRLPDPTQIAFDGKRLLVVADSGWELAGKNAPRTSGAPIFAIPLGKDCRPLWS